MPIFTIKSSDMKDVRVTSWVAAAPTITPAMVIGPANGIGFRQQIGTMHTKNTTMFIEAAIEVRLQHELMKTPIDDVVRALIKKSMASGPSANG